MPINLEKVLANKPKIEDDKGNEIIDLTHSALKDADFIFSGTYEVTSNFEMRPDLLCYVIYGDTSRMDEVFKANRISNPFAMNEGDIIFTPDVMTVNTHFSSLTSEEVETKDLIRNQYLDPSKQPDKDAAAREIEKFKKRDKLGLPPNILAEGEKEILIENGRVIYGPHVSEQKGTSNTKEEYLKKLTNGK